MLLRGKGKRAGNHYLMLNRSAVIRPIEMGPMRFLLRSNWMAIVIAWFAPPKASDGERQIMNPLTKTYIEDPATPTILAYGDWA